MQTTTTHIDGREEYSLYLSRLFKAVVSIYFVFLALATTGIFGWILLLIISARRFEPAGFSLLFVSGLPLLAVAWIWYWILSIPHTILLAPDGTITFISILGRKSINVGEISSIKPEQAGIGFLFVRSSRGKVRLLNRFDRFHDFIAKLKSMNPSITIRGC